MCVRFFPVLWVDPMSLGKPSWKTPVEQRIYGEVMYFMRQEVKMFL
jgi:hypothetical protein